MIPSRSRALCIDAARAAASLSFFMVNFSGLLLRRFRPLNPEFTLLDLKADYRGCRYVAETIKLLPQKPDGILLAEIFEQIARLGMVHPVLSQFLLHKLAKGLNIQQ